MKAVLLFAIWVSFVHCLNLIEIFRDNFDSVGLSESKWNSIIQNSEDDHELQYYTPEHVTVENGSLVITTNEKKFHGKDYTFGRVDTQNKFDFKYGEVEFRAKVPRGRGIWTSFSILDHRCNPIIVCEFREPSVTVVDILGDYTHEAVTTVYFKDGNPRNSRAKFTSLGDFSEDFHLYKLQWTSEELVWYVDKQEVFRVNESQRIPHTHMQIEMKVAVRGLFPGLPDEMTIFPNQLFVDYVVVRQHASLSNLLWSILGAIGGFLFLTALLITVYLRIHRKKKPNMTTPSDDMLLSTDRFAQGSNINFAVDPELQLYFSLVEVPMANLEISDDLLCSGEYGMVHKGVVRGLRGQPSSTVVAVKSCLPSNNLEITSSFLEEMKLMTKVGRHLNIVNLLGVVYEGKNLLIFEYCPFGSLLKYLRNHRGAYLYIHVDHSGRLLPFDEREHKRLEKEAAELHQRQAFPEENFDERVLSTNDCINFAYQISRGMEFLASKQIIHRDLAARNILVSQNKIAKISDFGLAGQKQEEYLSSTHVALRVKWMPPESILQRKFSQKSDVWSYGILLWEIFSGGEMPFSNSGVGSFGADFVSWLQKGFRLKWPSAAPIEMYFIMKKCWNLNVAQRPNFTELRLDLEKLVNRDYYLEQDLPYQKFNLGYEKLLSQPLKNEGSRSMVAENCLYIYEGTPL